MEYCYCINPESEVPIMLINKHIGYDEEMGYGIDGAEFQKELLTLDGMGKKSISIWINSGGGQVMDGLNIASAILFSVTKVDTFCMGLAASIAGLIFMCGRNRSIVEHGRIMMHPASNSTSSSSLRQLESMIATAISSRMDKTPEEILKLMAKTTWIDSETAVKEGYATEKIINSDVNKSRKMATLDETALMKNANLEIMQIVNSYKDTNEKFKTDNMDALKIEDLNKISNSLSLVEGSNVATILGAIESIKNKAKTTEDDLTQKLNTANEASLATSKELEKIKNEYELLKKAKEDSETATKTELSKKIIEDAVKLGKIQNSEPIVKTWTDKLIADFEGTKALLDSLGVTKNTATLDNGQGAFKFNAVGFIAQNMIDTKNKLENAK